MVLKIRSGVFCWLCAVIFLLGLNACESRRKMSELKDSLGKTAEQYWTNRLIMGDFRQCYDLEIEDGRLPYPEYVKKVKPAGQIKFLSIKTKEVNIDKDNGVVSLLAKHDIPGIPSPKSGRRKALESTITDKWIYTSKGWRHEGRT